MVVNFSVVKGPKVVNFYIIIHRCQWIYQASFLENDLLLFVAFENHFPQSLPA
jgi:hypothetical protein